MVAFKIKMQQRLIWADSLKGMLMILVIIGHAIQTVLINEYNDNHVWNIIYSFHMPAFMAVSGWFAYKKKQTLMGGAFTYRRRVYQLLIPYLVWSMLSYIISGTYTIERLSKIILYPDTYFWFLWVLFLISIIFLFDEWIADTLGIDKMLPVIMTCMLLFGIMVAFEVRIFGYQFLSYYFLFYTLGYCMHRFELLQIKSKAILIGLIVIWALLAWSWNMHGLPSWMPTIPYIPTALLQYAYRGLTAFVAILIIFGLAPHTLNGTNKMNLWMKEVGVVSLGIYVCHLLIMGRIVEGLKSLLNETNNLELIILTTISSFVSTMLIVELLKCNKYTARLFLGKL